MNNNNGSKFMSVENVNAYYESKRQNLDFWVAKQKQGFAMMQNSMGDPVMFNQGLSMKTEAEYNITQLGMDLSAEINALGLIHTHKGDSGKK